MGVWEGTVNELHLFAGAGGGILGGMLLGHTCVCAVEIEPYPRAVLLQRQRDGILPRFPIWDDVCTFDGKPWRGSVDIVCGGFPCQDISAAGKGAGIDGSRSGLWSEMARIIGEVQPRYALVENSPMLTLRGLGRVLGDLAEMGYDARWGVLGHDNCGGDHSRKRIWIVAYRDKTAILNRSVFSGEDPQQRNESIRRKSGLNFLVGDDGTPLALWSASCLGNDSRSLLWGGSDGLANGLDRIAAIGNGQVPAVVRLAWNILSGQEQP